jgi:hypothetical protein
LGEVALGRLPTVPTVPTVPILPVSGEGPTVPRLPVSGEEALGRFPHPAVLGEVALGLPVSGEGPTVPRLPVSEEVASVSRHLALGQEASVKEV